MHSIAQHQDSITQPYSCRYACDAVAKDSGVGGSVIKWAFQTSDTHDRPRPLYRSTARQLGLLSWAGVAPLLDSVIEPHAPAMAKHYLRKLLLVPPGRKVAEALRTAVDLTLRDRGPAPVHSPLNT
jgi:hypothetical protein